MEIFCVFLRSCSLYRILHPKQRSLEKLWNYPNLHLSFKDMLKLFQKKKCYLTYICHICENFKDYAQVLRCFYPKDTQIIRNYLNMWCIHRRSLCSLEQITKLYNLKFITKLLFKLRSGDFGIKFRITWC